MVDYVKMATSLRILLIQPAWEGLSYRRKIKVNERAIHPLSLGVVAALCGRHEVRIVDEAREELPASGHGFDVAGISINTFNAPRAYLVADRLRAEGVPVVFGGPHTALLSEECLQHADSIVIGDAEDGQHFATGHHRLLAGEPLPVNCVGYGGFVARLKPAP